MFSAATEAAQVQVRSSAVPPERLSLGHNLSEVRSTPFSYLPR